MLVYNKVYRHKQGGLKMKRTIKALFITGILTMIFAIPVMAQEVTDPEKVIKEEVFVAGEDALAQEFHNSQIWRSDNYVKYLDGVIFNLNETARIKKEIVTNYTYLSQYNPAFRDKIPQAQADYDKAVAWVNAYKEYRQAVKADLKARYKY